MPLWKGFRMCSLVCECFMGGVFLLRFRGNHCFCQALFLFVRVWGNYRSHGLGLLLVWLERIYSYENKFDLVCLKCTLRTTWGWACIKMWLVVTLLISDSSLSANCYNSVIWSLYWILAQNNLAFTVKHLCNCYGWKNDSRRDASCNQCYSYCTNLLHLSWNQCCVVGVRINSELRLFIWPERVERWSVWLWCTSSCGWQLRLEDVGGRHCEAVFVFPSFHKRKKSRGEFKKQVTLSCDSQNYHDTKAETITAAVSSYGFLNKYLVYCFLIPL